MEETKNSYGGRRDPVASRPDLIPAEAIEACGEAFASGEARYGRLDDAPTQPNWVGQDLASEQSSLGHLIRHAYAHASGDDSEDHLARIMANAAILIWFRDNPGSRYYGLRYPEILGGGTHAESLVENPSTEPGFIRSVLASIGVSLDANDQER